MKKRILVTLLSVCILFAYGCKKESGQDGLTIFAGAGLIKPMGDLIHAFEKNENIKIKAHYGSSGEIFGMIATGQYCDVLIPGAEKYTEDALKNKWIKGETIKKIVLHIPVIIVPKGNPANITSLEDMGRPGVKVALGDPKGPAIGRVSKKLLKKNKIWDKVKKNTVVKGPTVNQLIIYPALKQVDAAIVWKDITAWAEDKGKVETVLIPAKENIIKTIPTAVTTRTKQAAMAEKFNNFIASKKGLNIWKKWGFDSCSK